MAFSNSDHNPKELKYQKCVYDVGKCVCVWGGGGGLNNDVLVENSFSEDIVMDEWIERQAYLIILSYR